MNEELQNKVKELSAQVDFLSNKLNESNQKIESISTKLREHFHNGEDNTLILSKNIRLDKDQTIKIADCELGQVIQNIDTANEIDTLAISVGRDPRSGFLSNSGNAQVSFVHNPNTTISYISGFRPPLYFSGTGISTTLGGTTVVFSRNNFVVNELTGSLIDIFDSSGNLVETQVIASNTATTITISGTWLATTTGGTAYIFFPMYLGISNFPWQRAYVMDGTAGGIRFGGGTTNGGQNGLLYMDSAGDIYWRNKAGASTKLN